MRFQATSRALAQDIEGHQIFTKSAHRDRSLNPVVRRARHFVGVLANKVIIGSSHTAATV